LLPEKNLEDNRQASASSGKKKPNSPSKGTTSPPKLKKPAPSSAAAIPKKANNAFVHKKAPSSGTPKPSPGAAVRKNEIRPQKAKRPAPIKNTTASKTPTRRGQTLQPSDSGRLPKSGSTGQRSTRSPAMGKTTGRGRLDDLNTIDNSQLKLQAIAWSDDAARRMAVINNQIVREGQTVDGFSINSIRKDDVIVYDGTRSWRLEFTLEQ
jgi:hypothetical protein